MTADGLLEWLSDNTDDIIACSLTEEDTRPRCTPHEQGLLLILRGVNLNPGSDPEDMVSIRIWATEKLILSVRKRRLLAVLNLRERVEAGQGPRSVADFLFTLTDGLTDLICPVVSGMIEQVDKLEAEILEGRQTGVSAIVSDIRRDTIILRRYIAPQRDALISLASAKDKMIDSEARLNMREVVDQITRVIEDLDSIRERCIILNDHLKDERAEDMNNRLMVLSVVAAIFLPLGLITGLLGVNLAGMPGTDHAWAFPALCLALVALGAALAWWFHSRDWL